MTAPLMSVERHPSRDHDPLAVLTALLVELRDVITLLPAHCYRAQPAARVSGSVGAHVRHTLDHVAALLAAIDGDELRYDQRRRGTTLEIDALSAVNEIERLMFRMRRIDLDGLDLPLTFSTRLHPAQPPIPVRTTLARELAFVIQHTVHHCALIGVLLAWQGQQVPYGFGLAASTPRTHAMAG
jgi:uncharacterized damage-inducible protein DinB